MGETRAPVSTTCETWTDNTRTQCGKPAVRGYPAMGGGYHMMCEAHAKRHLPYCVTLEQARRGEQPDYPSLPAPRSEPLHKRIAECARLRRELGITVEDAAAAVGVSVPTFSGWERGYFSSMGGTRRYEEFIARRRSTREGAA